MRDWDEHRLVLALHRGGTLRAAAEHLGVTHTTVSRRLAALETAQSTPIFSRSGRSLTISDYGRQRVVIAVQIEALDFEAGRLERGAVGDLSGPLSLSVPQAFLQYMLMDDIAAFATAHPDIDLTVVGSDSIVDLDRGQADVVLRGQIDPNPNLVGRKISTVGISFYANRDYLDRTPPDQLRWISTVKSLSTDGSSQSESWVARSPFPKAPIGLIIDDIVSRYIAVSNGLGLGRLACFMGDSNPHLIRITEADPIQPYDLWILTHPDLRETPKVRALMRWLSDALKPKRASLVGLTAN